MNATALTFRDTTFRPVTRDGQPWLTAAEIAEALGYSRTDKVTEIYSRNKAEFTDSMTQTLKLRVSGEINGLQHKKARIFSLRGAHLIGMFARTKLAAEFRRWVLDILDQYTAQLPQNSETTQPHLTYATQEQREPLIKAVRRLVSVSHAKGRPLTYEDAHSIINLKMGVDNVEALTLEQIPKAMTLVGEILERVVLEGEYISKDEDSRYGYDTHQADEEYITSEQRRELEEAVNRALRLVKHDCGDSGRQWTYNRLRVKLNLRRMEEMRVDQFPAALAELEQLEKDLWEYVKHRSELHTYLCRKIIGAGIPWTSNLAKKWKAKMERKVLPIRPDWLLMREKLLSQAEEK